MEARQALERDWSCLPPEVLNLIAKDLREIPDYVRFRAVCQAWRFSTPVTELPPQFPWIVERWRDNPDMRFYSMSFDKTYIIRDPKILNQRLCELTEGYLLVNLSESLFTTQLCLLNPLNNHKIPLPVCDYYSYWFLHRHNKIGEYGLCCEFFFLNSKHKFVFYRLGQDQWCKPILDIRYNNCDPFYLKGMLFTLEKTGATKVTDITTGTRSCVPPVEGYSTIEHSHLLEAFGDIVGVFGRYNEHADLLYEVHHLDVNQSGSPCWVEVKNIGHHALFIDRNGGFMLKADDFSGIKANCIYYFKEIYVGSCRRTLYEMVRIDMETGAKEHRRCPANFRNGVGWFRPSLCHLQVNDSCN